MANATLRDLIVGMQPGLETVIGHLTKKSGILKTGLALPANKGIKHQYKKLTALPSFTVGGITQTLTDVTTNKGIYEVDLASIDAIQSEFKKVCDNYPGGAQAYFRDNFYAFIESWGQAAAKQIVYGTDSSFGNVGGFRGWHQITNASGKVIQETGTTAYTTSIFAVKWDPISHGLLFNPNHVTGGDFLKIQPLHGGNPYPEVVNDGGSDQEKKLVYGVLYESYLGLFSGSEFDVACYSRIQDDTNDKPEAAYLDKLIDYVHGDEGNTFLYMNRTARRLCRELKNSKFEMGAMDKNYDVRIDYWNGIPIVTDENIVDTETSGLN